MRKFKPRYILYALLVLVLAFVLYLLVHDPGVPINTWTPDGNFSITEEQKNIIGNDKLRYLDISPYKDPETIQIHNGQIYAAVDGGSIIRLNEDGSDLKQVLHTGGSILGFDFDSNGILYFCDCNYNSAAAVCKFDGENMIRLPVFGITYPDAICIDDLNGILYFSNASGVSPSDLSCSPQDAYMTDMFAHTNTGSVVSFALDTGEQHTVADGFSFANGLQLTDNGKSLLINETSGNRIWKVDIETGRKNPVLTIPGYPDNLHSGSDGYTSGFAGVYSAAYSELADKPLIRKVILNLPRFVISSLNGSTDAIFIKYDSEGVVKEYNIIPDAGFTATGAVETEERVYLETISGIGKIVYYEK